MYVARQPGSQVASKAGGKEEKQAGRQGGCLLGRQQGSQVGWEVERLEGCKESNRLGLGNKAGMPLGRRANR
jgi:hypothetical protein